MEFKPQKKWKVNCSVTEGRSKAGQIIYKGTVPVVEIGVDGKERTVTRHKFLVRYGKNAYDTVVGTTSDAREKLYALIAGVGSGEVLPRTGTRVDSFIREEFLPHKAARVAGKTIQNYRQDAENHVIPALGSKRLEDLGTQLLDGFVTRLLAKGLSPKSISNIFGVLRAALSLAVTWQRIPTNPAKLVELPKPSKKEKAEKRRRDRLKAWARAEMLRFFLIAPHDHELTRWAVVGCTAGLRPGEQCALTWTDWYDGRVTVHEAVYEADTEARKADPSLEKWRLGSTKTGEIRTIRVTGEAEEALKSQRKHVNKLLENGEISAEQARFIFPNRGGDQAFTNPDRIYERWRFFLKGNKNTAPKPEHERLKGGRPRRKPLDVRYISPYGLRHTHATALLRDGENVQFVAERLGTSVEMIEHHYGHILDEMEAKAIASASPVGYSPGKALEQGEEQSEAPERKAS